MPKIIVRREGVLVATFTVTDKVFAIGAAQNCAVAVEDVGLPPQAAEVTSGESGFTLKRLSPIPDLRINLERVDQFAELEDGDEIKLDDYSLIFNLLPEELAATEPEPEPEAPAPVAEPQAAEPESVGESASDMPADEASVAQEVSPEPVEESPAPPPAEPAPPPPSAPAPPPPMPASPPPAPTPVQESPPSKPPEARAEPPVAPPPAPDPHPKTVVQLTPPPESPAEKAPEPPPAPPPAEKAPEPPSAPPPAEKPSEPPPAAPPPPDPGRKTKVMGEAEVPRAKAAPAQPARADHEATQFVGDVMTQRFILIAIGGPLEGQRFQLGETETRIGRDPKQNDIVIRFDKNGEVDTSISRQHCVITHDAGRYVMRDPKSKTRTIHNGKVLKADETVVLAHGDTIEIRSLQENTSFRVMKEGEWEAPERLVSEDNRTPGGKLPWWKRFLPGSVFLVALLLMAVFWLRSGPAPDRAADITFSTATPWPASGGIQSATGAFLALGDSVLLLAYAGTDGDVEWLRQGKATHTPLLGLKAVNLPMLALDINGDGNDDLVLISAEHRLYAYDGVRGSRLGATEWFAEAYGSPPAGTQTDALGVVVAAHSDGGKLAAYRAEDATVLRRELYYNGRTMGAGTFADCDQDGYDDYIVGTDDGQVIWISSRSGEMETVDVHGLATASDPTLGASALQIRAPVAAFDFTADGRPEWILLSRQGDLIVFDHHLGRLLALHRFGSRLRQLPTRYPGPVLADLDLDGIPEIIVAHSAGTLHAFRTPRTVGDSFSEFWPPVPTGPLNFEPALVDLNGDRSPELCASTGEGELVVVDGAQGATLYRVNLGAQGPPLVADADGDGELEIMTPAGSHWAVVSTNAAAGQAGAWRQWRGQASRAGTYLTPPARRLRPWISTIILTLVAIAAVLLWVRFQ